MPVLFNWSDALANLPGKPVPDAWIASGGKGVKVAYIDTGANLALPSFTRLKNEDRRFFTGAPTFSVAKLTGKDLVQDSYPQTGHGTKYLSLLAGTDANPAADEDILQGFADQAEYYIIKARDQNDVTTTVRNLLDALELAANLDIDLCVVGLTLSAAKIRSEPNMSEAEVERVFSLHGVRKMHIFCALENRDTGDPWDNIAGQMFPNLRPEVFNVARLPYDIDVLADVIRPQPVHFLAAGFEGNSVLTKVGTVEKMIDADSAEARTSLGAFKIFSNSCAVAIVGGVATLACSVFKDQNSGALPDRQQLAALLNGCFAPLDDALNTFEEPAFFTNLDAAGV
jgi:hypothetical protein